MNTLDMDALTNRQREVLGAIACGDDQHHHRKVLKALADLGLIVEHRVRLADGLPVEISRWEVPLDVHIQWAEWCAAQPDDVEEVDAPCCTPADATHTLPNGHSVFCRNEMTKERS
ncbi:hypothetical protein ACFFX1_55440 [Dactylosporangium sucinum]|uniref:Uncharacterized protein n=1 Tax=Dactylosporangium sucinum TaxID=1424081 RepID=A0A917U2U4_9ACTN|nr:hypothetical protein [Dactylosporangium sucinum]GGM52635.1 hypothetical protein GCM10007977_062760 [Dactylosporangium sucinum]